jgi:hypothetical protein
MPIETTSRDTTRITAKVLLDGLPLDLTPFESITFHAFSGDGNYITKTLGAGVELAAQSGATLGWIYVSIARTDYPAPWRALPHGQKLTVDYWVEIADGPVGYTPVVDTWEITGKRALPAAV